MYIKKYMERTTVVRYATRAHGVSTVSRRDIYVARSYTLKRFHQQAHVYANMLDSYIQQLLQSIIHLMEKEEEEKREEFF